jgi:HEPN domain-containing protein
MQQHPRELDGNWLEQARRDLDSARYLFEGARYDAACFASQQAAEKALEAALIWLAGERPRTHQLGALVAEVALHRPDAIEALGDLAALDPYYVTTRYPDAIGGGIPGASFFAPEGRLALDRGARAVAYVEALLPKPAP